MAKLTLTDLTNLQNETSVVAAINANNAAIETALEKTLSRDGTSPNSMGADLDMNNNQILNLPAPVDSTDPVRLGDFADLVELYGVAGPAGPAGADGTDGADGTNGVDGADGALIFVQNDAPSTSNPANSIWIDANSTNQDLYQLTAGVWVDTTVNLKGTDGTNGTNGADGAEIYVQNTAPATSGVPEGSLWIDADSTQNDLYILTAGSWVDSGVNLKGADGLGSGDVTAAANFGTDNVLTKSDGTGKGVQATGISVDDSNNVTGVVGLTATTVTSTTSIPTTIELGHASDTTLARVSAGVMSVEGETVHTNSTSRTVTVAGVELGHATDTTLARVSAGVASIEGETIHTNSTSRTATVSTLELGHATDTTLSRSSAGVLAVEGVPVALNSTSATHTAGTVELGHASDTTVTRTAAGKIAVEGTAVKLAGVETLYVPAGAMVARTTNGAAVGTVEMTTNKNMFRTLDFDTTTQEFAQFSVRMPKSWNEGTVTAAFTWSHASTTTNFGVVWALEAVALSDDDAGDVAFGAAQQIADTGGTTNDIYITSATPSITIAGTPQAEDFVIFQVKRVPADASDTMAIDARLHGVTLYITTDAANDA